MSIIIRTVGHVGVQRPVNITSVDQDQRLPPLYNCVATEEISEEDVSAPGGIMAEALLRAVWGVFLGKRCFGAAGRRRDGFRRLQDIGSV